MGAAFFICFPKFVLCKMRLPKGYVKGYFFQMTYIAFGIERINGRLRRDAFKIGVHASIGVYGLLDR